MKLRLPCGITPVFRWFCLNLIDSEISVIVLHTCVFQCRSGNVIWMKTQMQDIWSSYQGNTGSEHHTAFIGVLCLSDCIRCLEGKVMCSGASVHSHFISTAVFPCRDHPVPILRRTGQRLKMVKWLTQSYTASVIYSLSDFRIRVLSILLCYEVMVFTFNLLVCFQKIYT